MPPIATAADIDALKARLRATWMDGNYDYFSRFMESSAVEFLDRLGLEPGISLLDVACGSGQLSLVAARRGAKVTGLDIATNSILVARGRAASESIDARFDEGDAESLPYPDGSFDVVATIFGAMFAPRPDRVAAEMLRVGKRVFCQTPCRLFPIDPHLGAFFLHWLPGSWLKPGLLRYFTLNGLMWKRAYEYDVTWISKKKLKQMFPGCQVRTEWFLLMPKSFVVTN